MRLIELSPVWLKQDGTVTGLTFLCPHCLKDRLTCFSKPVPFKEQVKIMHAAMNITPEDEDAWPIDWVPCNPMASWTLSNTHDFNTLTITPSIDASTSGNWHGFIRDGAIVGT